MNEGPPIQKVMDGLKYGYGTVLSAEECEVLLKYIDAQELASYDRALENNRDAIYSYNKNN